MEADRSVKEIMYELKLHLGDPMNQVATSTSLQVQLVGNVSSTRTTVIVRSSMTQSCSLPT